VIDEFTDIAGVREEETHSDEPKKSQSITFRLGSDTLPIWSVLVFGYFAETISKQRG
jgi:hypothetical protein